MKQLKLDIKGLKWTFRMFTRKTLFKRHKDFILPGEKIRAVTNPEKLCIELSKEDFSLGVCLHELGHVFYYACLTSDSNLKRDQVEENFCKILEFHLEDIREKANLVYRHFTNEEK